MRPSSSASVSFMPATGSSSRQYCRLECERAHDLDAALVSVGQFAGKLGGGFAHSHFRH